MSIWPGTARALQIPDQQRVDLLVTDVDMPILNGPGFWAQRIWITFPRLPVLFLSGSGDAAQHLPRNPAARYEIIHKPFSMLNLLNAAEGLLDARDDESTRAFTKRTSPAAIILVARESVVAVTICPLEGCSAAAANSRFPTAGGRLGAAAFFCSCLITGGPYCNQCYSLQTSRRNAQICPVIVRPQELPRRVSDTLENTSFTGAVVPASMPFTSSGRDEVKLMNINQPPVESTRGSCSPSATTARARR